MATVRDEGKVDDCVRLMWESVERRSERRGGQQMIVSTMVWYGMRLTVAVESSITR